MRRLLNIFRKKVVAPKPASDEERPFKERYGYFKKLLSENNAVLEIMADLEDKRSGEYIFDMNYIRTSCSKLVDSVQNIIVNLDKLSKGKYPNLYFAFAKINSKIEATHSALSPTVIGTPMPMYSVIMVYGTFSMPVLFPKRSA